MIENLSPVYGQVFNHSFSYDQASDQMELKAFFYLNGVCKIIKIHTDFTIEERVGFSLSLRAVDLVTLCPGTVTYQIILTNGDPAKSLFNGTITISNVPSAYSGNFSFLPGGCIAQSFTTDGEFTQKVPPMSHGFLMLVFNPTLSAGIVTLNAAYEGGSGDCSVQFVEGQSMQIYTDPLWAIKNEELTLSMSGSPSLPMPVKVSVFYLTMPNI